LCQVTRPERGQDLTEREIPEANRKHRHFCQHFARDIGVFVEMVVEIPGTGLYDNSTTNKRCVI
jgi:hypothetical protein